VATATAKSTSKPVISKSAAAKSAIIALKEPENHLDKLESRWFAIRTRFKSEKLALKQLTQNGISAYLPIRNMTRRYNRKIRHVELPLINSFVFVKIRQTEYNTVLETEYVAGFLRFGKNLLSIPEQQIDLIKRLLGEKIEIVVEQTGFIKGDWVEVTAGPLLGMTGQLVMIHGKERVLVELLNSGYTLQIAIDNYLLKKI
jgi:transcription antitermination factor NusG